MTLLEIDAVGMYDTAVERRGKTFVTTELGGGGTATARSIRIAKKGARNVLKHAGILDGEPEIGPSVMLDTPDGDCFVFSEHDGLIEPLVDLGESVGEGEAIARIWPADRAGIPPIDYSAKRAGLLAARHFPGLVKAGDCLAVVAVEATDPPPLA
jgi:N-alpha-acetyl-L-2,4-diaminobutyrate deacetylase